MVRQRVFYGSLLMAGLVSLTVADAWLSAPCTGPACPMRTGLGFGGLTTIGFALVVIAGAGELCRFCDKAGHRPAVGWGLVMVACMMLAPWLNSATPRIGYGAYGGGWVAPNVLEPPLPWIAILGTAVILVGRQRTEGAIASFATTLLIIFYLGYLGSYCVRLRCAWSGPEGAWIVLATLVIIKVTDIGAYFTGIAIGKTPLIPKVSPKKTWEGILGGVAASAAISGVLMWWVLPQWGGCDSLKGLSFPQAIVFGIVMAIVGQLGDLAESLFKRDAGAKDSARLVPTFGGVLDIIDSPLLAVPVAYWLLRWWWLA